VAVVKGENELRKELPDRLLIDDFFAVSVSFDVGVEISSLAWLMIVND
jgi:hypothetical protein